MSNPRNKMLKKKWKQSKYLLPSLTVNTTAPEIFAHKSYTNYIKEYEDYLMWGNISRVKIDDMTDEERDNIWTMTQVGSLREVVVKNPRKMKVKCINTEKTLSVKLDGVYEVVLESEEYYYLKGFSGGLYKYRFEILEDYDEIDRNNISKFFEEKVKQLQNEQ